MRSLIRWPVGVVVILSLSLMACKSDEFAGAKGATAPKAKSNAANPTTSAGKTTAKGAPIPSSGQLPADHPPLPSATGPNPTDKAPRPRVPVTAGKAGALGTSGALLWTAPSGWQSVKPASSMRMGEYLVEGKDGAAVMSIFFGLGGGVEANMNRWAGQFKGADGKTAEAKKSVRKIEGDITVHLIDVSGNFNAGAAMMGGAPKSDQRMLGAIVETPKGPYFFKLLGSSGTMKAQEAAFESFVSSFKPGA